MKRAIMFLAAIVMVLGFSANAVAQDNTEDVTVRASLVPAITLVKDGDLNFGNLQRPTTGNGTIVLNPFNVANLTNLTQVTSNTSTPTLTVTGIDGLTYAITLPTTDVTIMKTGASTDAQKMIVNAFKAWVGSTQTDVTTGAFSGSNISTFKVGATLTVKEQANQEAGIYTGTFEVSVLYN